MSSINTALQSLLYPSGTSSAANKTTKTEDVTSYLDKIDANRDGNVTKEELSASKEKLDKQGELISLLALFFPPLAGKAAEIKQQSKIAGVLTDNFDAIAGKDNQSGGISFQDINLVAREDGDIKTFTNKDLGKEDSSSGSSVLDKLVELFSKLLGGEGDLDLGSLLGS